MAEAVGQRVKADEAPQAAQDDGLLATILRQLIPAIVQAVTEQLAALFSNEIPVLLSEREARKYYMRVSRSTWQAYDQGGFIPASLKVNGRVFWRRQDMEFWVAWNCPGRERFNTLLKAENERAAKTR